MHRESSCFLLQLLLIISIKWLSHPAPFNPTLPSSQYHNMAWKRTFLLHIIWFLSAPQEVLRLSSSQQLLPFSVTHQIFDHHIKFPRIPLSPEVVNPSSSIDHRRGACLYWSPARIIHFILFIKSIFSRIVKAMWAEQKEKTGHDGRKFLPFDTWCCFPD